MDTTTDQPPAAGDDAPDPRVERIAAAINRWVWERRGPHAAAVRVLADAELRHALAAADVVAVLDREHQPVRWAADSDVVVCTAGCGAHPCHTRDVLDRMTAR
jgi:hypothetical protein